MEAWSAARSNGKSRNTSLTLPVSMKSFLSCGSVLAWKLAQCGQVSDEYSRIVIGALGSPSTRSLMGSFFSAILGATVWGAEVCGAGAWGAGAWVSGAGVSGFWAGSP